MKVAIFPDSAMVLLNQVNKSQHELLSNYDRMYKERMNQETMEEYRKDVNKSSEKSIHDMPYLVPRHGIKYSGTEAPSGVLGRMSIIGPVIDEAEAVIMMSGSPKNHMYNTLNELILFGGGTGCLNTKLLMESQIREKNIPFLILDYPNTAQEIIELIDEINNFLDYLGELEEGKANGEYVRKYPRRIIDEKMDLNKFTMMLEKSIK